MLVNTQLDGYFDARRFFFFLFSKARAIKFETRKCVTQREACFICPLIKEFCYNERALCDLKNSLR